MMNCAVLHPAILHKPMVSALGAFFRLRCYWSKSDYCRAPDWQRVRKDSDLSGRKPNKNSAKAAFGRRLLQQVRTPSWRKCVLGPVASVVVLDGLKNRTADLYR